MADHPMIFSAPMTKALLREADAPGTGKTQTRRALKLPTKGEYVRKDMGGWEPTTYGGEGCFTFGRGGERIPVPEQVAIWNQTTGTCIVTRHQQRDRIWVRETWKVLGRERDGETELSLEFRADGNKFNFATAEEWGTALAWWRKHKGTRSPIHMPRIFSRLTLTVSNVRIERLNDISEEDAIAEGTRCVSVSDIPRHAATSERQDFSRIWESINGVGSWASNPWCAVISFTVAHANIDSLPKSEAA